MEDRWEAQLAGLQHPAVMPDADFYWAPGHPGDDKQGLFQQTGLSQWYFDQYWKQESDLSSVKFYSPSGTGGAMKLDPPTSVPNFSELGELKPVKGSVIGYCHC